MISSANLSILTVLCAVTFIRAFAVPIGKEDICAALKNIEQQIPCDKLETSFKSGNCSESDECLEKKKLKECFHGLIFNGTKYTADNECLQFYCNCFEGMRLTQEIPESDNSTMDSVNDTISMTSNVGQGESSANSTETSPETLDTVNLDMSESNVTEMHSEKPDILNIDVSKSNSAELEYEEMDTNNTHSLVNMTSGKYIRPQEPETGNRADSDLNHRSGDRKTPMVVQPYGTQETSTRNIYDTDDRDKKNLMDQQDKHHHEESTGHSSKATSTSSIYTPVLFLTFCTPLFVFC